VLRSVVFNYSQGFRFVWDEIKTRLTYESDHIHARQMLLRIVKETVANDFEEAQRSWKWVVENYRIGNTSLEPTVTLVVKDGALEFSVNYIVDYTKRTVIKDHLFTKIVDAVANSSGRLQWSSVPNTSGVGTVSSVPTTAINRAGQQPR
jgi:small-conductance mechanosensitive channel